MKHLNISLLALFLFSASICQAQNIKVQPYLQDALPNSIYILWETDSGVESIVEWGLTNALGNSTAGISETHVGTAEIHTVQLTELERFTTYYYKVITGEAESEIYSFKTPPFASDHKSFRMVAMSDMQQDWLMPNKFEDVVHDGVISYLENEIGGELIDNLGLVIIPGDLVQTGGNYGSWETTFFDPAADLFSQVPVYPVLGNHENNTVYYFNYFKLPENGTPGFEERWWHKDYGNVRIIGMDSNSPFNTQEQLDWLQVVLDETCSADSIDFVFAQLHHPHHSELWTPGESGFTGAVITRLEQFSTSCEKPSIHFFGHTHAYSRGHSRDHKHLMINAATAGGAIDNWGEFPNFDYDEYAVSTDDYGFVSVEITADDDPRVTVKHYSIGDQDVVTPYTLNDSIVMRRNPTIIDTPTPEYPVGITIPPDCVILKADEFSTQNGQATHGQSHWQVTAVENDFSTLTAESWKNFENWYSEVDTQVDDDLTDEEMLNLANNMTYWWRVRYRDKELNWSEWSEVAAFETAESSFSGNLLINPGAENDLDQWEITEGVVEAQTDGNCDGIAPNSGDKYFAVGGLCDHSEVGRVIQSVDVSAYLDSIDAEVYSAKFGGYMSNYSGSDLPEMRLLFFDENELLLEETEYISSLISTWTLHSSTVEIPAQTRTILFEMKGTRSVGLDNDSYFDDVFLQLGSTTMDCSGITSVYNASAPRIAKLQMSPNPVENSGFIELANAGQNGDKIHIFNASGNKLIPSVNYSDRGINVDCSTLNAGIYFFMVRRKGNLVGAGKFVVN